MTRKTQEKASSMPSSTTQPKAGEAATSGLADTTTHLSTTETTPDVRSLYDGRTDLEKVELWLEHCVETSAILVDTPDLSYSQQLVTSTSATTFAAVLECLRDRVWERWWDW